MKPRPPANPQTLDELLLMAADFAEFALRRGGQIPPTLIVATQKRPLIFTPDSFRDDRGKDEFAATCRWICIAYQVPAAVMILESWIEMGAEEEKPRRWRSNAAIVGSAFHGDTFSKRLSIRGGMRYPMPMQRIPSARQKRPQTSVCWRLGLHAA